MSPARRFHRALLWVIGTPVVILTVFALLLEIHPVATRVVNLVAARVGPWPHSRLAAGSVHITDLGHISLADVTLTRADGQMMAAIDTLVLAFRPAALTKRHIVFRGVRVVGANVVLRQQPDSSWDLLAPFASVDTTPVRAGLRISIDNAEVVRSRGEARFLAAHDSVLRFEGVQAKLDHLRFPEKPSLRLDTLVAEITPPTRRTAAHFSARLDLENGVLTAHGVRLVSDSSDLSAAGTMLVSTATDTALSNIDFRLAALPLDFRDISAFAPGFDVAGSLRVEARVTGSSELMHFDASGQSFDGATFDARGELTPNTDSAGVRRPARYVVDARVRGLDPRLWKDDRPVTRSLELGREGINVDAHVALDGTSLDSMSGNAHVSLGRTSITRNVVLLPSTVDATFHAGAAQFTVVGGVARWARIRATGTARPFDARPRYDITSHVEQIGDTVFGGVRIANVRADVHAAGTGIVLDSAVGNASIRLDATIDSSPVRNAQVRAAWTPDSALAHVDAARLTWRANTLDTISATGACVKASCNVTAAGSGPIAAFSLNGSGRLIDTTQARGKPRDLDWNIRQLTVRNLDLSRVRDSLPGSNINATATASGRGTAPALARADGSLTITKSRIGTHTIDMGAVAFTMRDGLLDVRGDTRALQGHANIVATLRPFDEVVSFNVSSLRFDDIALDEGVAGPKARLAGVAKASGELPPGMLPRVAGRVDLEPTPFRNGRIRDGHVVFALRDSVVTANIDVATGEGTMQALANGRLVNNTTRAWDITNAHAEGHVFLPDLDALLGRDSTNQAALVARFTADGSGRVLRTMVWKADVAATGKYGTARLDTLTLRGALADGVLRVDTLVLRSNAGKGDAGGALAVLHDVAPPDSAHLRLRLVADTAFALKSLLPVDYLSLRKGTLTVDAKNDSGGIDADTRFLVRGLISPSVWADSLSANGSVRLVDGKLTGLKTTFGGIDLGYGTAEFSSLGGKVDYDTKNANFDFKLQRDNRHTMRLAGKAIPGEHSVTLANMDVVVAGSSWALVKPATVVLSPHVSVDSLVLAQGAHRIALNGVIDRLGTQDLTLAFSDVPVQGFGEFIGFQGIDGTLALTGPASRVAVKSDLRVRLLSAKGTVALTPAPDGRTAVDVQFTDSLGKHLSARGTVPLAISIAPGDTTMFDESGAIQLDMVADSFAIGWLTPLARPFGVTRLAGAVSANGKMGGTFADPALSGHGALIAAAVDYPLQGIKYRNIHGEFALESNRIRVTGLNVTAGGTAVIDGDIVLANAASAKLDLRGRFHDFRAAKNVWVDLGVSGDARITGDLLTPKVEGTLTTVNTTVFADAVGAGGAGTAVELTKADFDMLEYYFGYVPTKREIIADPFAAFGLDLKLIVGNNTWLRRTSQPVIAVHLDGSLDVKKQPADSMQLFGSVEAMPERSYFEEFGRRFAVTHGRATFNGLVSGWDVDVGAQYKVPSLQDPNAPEVTITLAVKGGATDLDLTLGGEPAMETADVLSYLATGRPAASAAEFGGGGDLTALGTSLAAGGVASVLEDAAKKNVGLDVVEIRQSGFKGATVVAGRYVNSRLFVGFEQPLTQQRVEQDKTLSQAQLTEVQLEYTWYKWLLLSLQGGQSNYQFFFRFRRAF